MSNIKCSQKKCKYNNCEHCMKDGIYVDKYASCDSYEEGKTIDNTKYEFASLENKNNKIVCNATQCLHNNHKSCSIHHLNIDKEKNESAVCTDFKNSL